MTCNQQLSILPGRFHPSTFDVQVLNYCVRYGNRWVHLAIVTGFILFCESLISREMFSHKQRTKTFVLCKSLSSLLATNFLGFLKDIFFQNYTEERNVCILVFVLALSQALDLLVSVRCTHYCASTPDLSTLSSSRGLTRLLCEKPHLKAGFTLRCFQRLSFPNVATQLYCWRNNWYTIGSSTPVLSY